jgi:tetratricopeptide (TPR) repeat protein
LYASGLEVVAVDSEPERKQIADLDAELERLRAAVESEPRKREHRFALCKQLFDAGRLEEALDAARTWRDEDAYDLVVVRMIGDILTELGRPADALRTYSAVTELLAENSEAQRALAAVLEQQGDHGSAVTRLERAVELNRDDARLRFELADVQMRAGKIDEAGAAFAAIVADERAGDAVRHPAKQRLAQIWSAERRRLATAGKDSEARAVKRRIDGLELEGGNENDIKVYLSWDTDRTDVDLWVTNPKGEKVMYSHRKDSHGGALYDDVTSGYGPESFTAPRAIAGDYKIEVDYFAAGRSSFTEARGEVTVVLDEGRESERVVVFPYRLFKPKQRVHVATVKVPQ